MAYTGRIAWEPLRSIDSVTFAGAYLPLGTPLANPSYICKIVNNSTALVLISIDGVNDIDVAPASSFWVYDEGKQGVSSVFPAIPAGTQFSVKGAAGTGLVYLVSQYIVQS